MRERKVPPASDRLRRRESLRNTSLPPSAFAMLVAAVGEIFDDAIKRGVPLEAAQQAVLEVLGRRDAPTDYFRAVALARHQTLRRTAGRQTTASGPTRQGLVNLNAARDSPSEPQQQRKPS